ncbi:MAG: LamG-like jellyroll fold domain-containing protein [Paludibacter sp.]|nr:LamG-like jellyroll fold domain-containing protein [Paludibacter sp.]
MKKIPYLFILILFSFCKTPVEIDLYGNIIGTVTDGISKEPVVGAIVTLSPSSSSARTGSDGKYSFVNLDPKDYKIDISSEGYANDTKTLTVKAGETTTGDFSLGSINPVLRLSTINIDFGTDQTLIPLEITNTGKGILTWNVVENVTWLTANPTSGSTTTQKSSVVITVDRLGLAEGSYNQSISVVSNGGVQIITVNMTVTNPNSPKLITGNAINISQTTADIIGTISSLGLGSILKHGHCYSTLPNPTINDKKTDLGATNSVGQFTSSLTGLLGNTTYYIRAYAINSLGTGYSTQVTFTTSASPTLPNVTTEAAKNITETTASITGEVATVGSTNITQHGHCWATTQNPTINETKTTLGSKTSIGTFTSNLSSLVAGTTYYVRAYATNTAGTSYSPQVSFTSLAAPTLPILTTNPNTNLKYNAVTFNGTLTNLGSVSVSEYGFCYANTQNPTLINNKLVSGINANAIGSFTVNATNLTQNTTYYVRAFATNSVGTAYGAQVTFTTPAIINPSLTFGSASSITYKSANVSGNITIQGDLPITEYGFCLSNIETIPTVSNTKKISTNLNNGAFSAQLIDLLQNTKYYIRTYAITSTGTYYSAVANFTTTADPYTVSDGLLAMYNFDGQNCNDALGGFNGVGVGNLTFTSSSPSTSGYAAQFDGSTGYINIPYQILPSTGSWTISLWLKTNKNSVNLMYCNNQFSITSASRLYFNIFIYESSFTNDLSTSLLNNSWHLLTMWYNGGTKKYYIDGTLQESISIPNNNLGNHDLTRIGAGQDLSNKFLGLMDNIRFYNRALSTTEITTLYNAKQ